MARFANIQREALVMVSASDAKVTHITATVTNTMDTTACHHSRRPTDKKFGSHTSGELMFKRMPFPGQFL